MPYAAAQVWSADPGNAGVSPALPGQDRLKPELQTLAYKHQCANLLSCLHKMTSRAR